MSDDEIQQYWGSPSLPAVRDGSLQPNEGAIRQHIEFLIAPAKGAFDDALFEIAYGANGPSSARLFGLDEVDEAVAFSAAKNRGRINTYLGATLKLPDTPRDARSSALDFYVATAVPVDVDENYDAVRQEMRSKLHDSPLTVTTGLTPTRRSHHWFLLKEVCTDRDEFAKAFAGLVCGIGGDKNVKDAARVMRLGGTVAYPDERKRNKGYKDEITRVDLNTAIQPVAIERLINLEPVPQLRDYRTSDPTGQNFDGEIVLDGMGLVIDGREQFFRNYLYHLVCKFQEDNGSDPDVEDVWGPAYAMFQRRCANPHEWPERELRHRAVRTIQRLMRDDLPTKSISGGKWQPRQSNDDWWGNFKALLPAAAGVVEYKIPPLKTLLELFAEYKPPHYLIDGVLQKGYLYTPTGRSGSGKTVAFIRIGVDVACGNPVGAFSTEQCNVAFFAGENPALVTNRLIMLCEKAGYDPKEVPFFTYSDTFKLDVGYQRVIDDAQRIGGFGLIIVDTFSAYCRENGIEENDNNAMGKWVKDVLRKLSQLPGNPCIVALSHPNRSSGKNPSTKDDLIPRGAYATLGEVDGNITVWREGNIIEIEAHAEKFRGAPFGALKMKMVSALSDKYRDTKGKPLNEIYAEYVTEEEIEREEDRQENTDITILRAMEDFFHDMDEWPSSRELAARCGISHSVIGGRQKFMATAKGLKLVAKTRRTKTAPYKLTPAGEEYLRELAAEANSKFTIET